MQPMRCNKMNDAPNKCIYFAFQLPNGKNGFSDDSPNSHHLSPLSHPLLS